MREEPGGDAAKTLEVLERPLVTEQQDTNATVTALAKFASCLFAGGKVGEARLLKPETIAEMLRPQFAKPEDKTGFGIGFRLSERTSSLSDTGLGHGDCTLGFKDSGLGGVERRFCPVRCRDRCIVLLTRDLIFRDERL